MKRGLVLLGLVLVGGVVRGERLEEGPPAPDAPKQRAALKAWLHDLGRDGDAVAPTDVALEPALPGIGPGKTIEFFGTVALSHGLIAFDGEPQRSSDALGPLIAQKRADAKRYRNASYTGLVIDIAGDADWASVVDVMQTVALSRIEVVRLRFSGRRVAAPFTSSPLDDRLAAARLKPTSERASDLARLMRPLFARCPAAGKGFGALANAPIKSRTAAFLSMLEHLPAAPACELEAPSVHAVVVVTAGAGPLRSIDLRLTDGAKLVLRALPNTTWHDALAQHVLDAAIATKGTPAVWFAVTPP